MFDYLNYYGIVLYTTSMIMWIAPIKSMYNLYHNKNEWEVPYNFYLVSLTNCLFWVIYGLQEEIWPLWSVNIPGMISFMGCIGFFMQYVQMRKFELVALILLMPVKLFIVAYVCYYYVPSYYTGIIALFFNIIMYFMPIEQIYYVIKAKNNVYIELWLAIALFINTLAWSIFGILLSDNWDIIIPNGVGFIISIIQLVVWCKYRVSKKYDKLSKNEDTVEHSRVSISDDKELQEIDISLS